MTDDTLRQLTLEQIKELAPETQVFIRLTCKTWGKISVDYQGYDTLLIKKKKYKRKPELITSIHPQLCPSQIFLIGMREALTHLAISTLWAEDNGNFYVESSVLWMLRVFAPHGEGDTLEAIKKKED